MVGYIAPSGEFIDVKKWCEVNRVESCFFSEHIAFCEEHGLDEDEDFLKKGYVKLTVCVKPYIFMGRRLTPEQVRILRTFDIEPDEWDLP